jgi:glycosyltransferase involved in cell wall biosynthesis
MRVLVVSHQFPRPDRPTSGIFVLEQAAALQRDGIHVRVLVGAEAWLGPSRPFWSLVRVGRFVAKPPRVEWREERGVIRGEFPTIVLGRLGGAARAFSYRWGFRRVLAEVYRDFPFQLVHAHTALLDGGAALAAKRELGVPVVLTEHTGPFGILTETRAMRRRVRRVLAEADRVVAVSNFLKRAILEAVPELRRSIEVVPNGVDPAIFHPRPDLCAEPPTVLWIGFFGALKRPLLALTAFASALRRMPNLRLRMIGRGPLEKELRLAVSAGDLGASVTIEDYQDREALAQLLASARAVLVTSAIETFSLVAAEALSAGTPVVSTRCGGPEEIVTAPWHGRLADNTSEALAEALVAVLAGDFCPERLHAEAVRRFGIGVVSRSIRAVYEDLVKPRTTISATTGIT